MLKAFLDFANIYNLFYMVDKRYREVIDIHMRNDLVISSGMKKLLSHDLA